MGIQIEGKVHSVSIDGVIHSVSIKGVVVYDEYWILRTGHWDDQGIWKDDEEWID